MGVALFATGFVNGWYSFCAHVWASKLVDGVSVWSMFFWPCFITFVSDTIEGTVVGGGGERQRVST